MIEIKDLEIFPLRFKKSEKGIEIFTIASWMQINNDYILKLYNWLRDVIESSDDIVMSKKYDKPNEAESIYKDLLYKVAKNNGFLVQKFRDYHNLVYCYNRFLQTGFEVNQVGSDTLIIRNK